MGQVVDSKRERDHPPGSTAGQMPAIRAAQVPGGVAAHWNGRSRSTVHAGVVGGGYVRIVQRDLGILVGPVQSREEAVFGQRPAEPAARARVVGRASVLDERVAGQVLEIERFENRSRCRQSERAIAVPGEYVTRPDGIGAFLQHRQVAELVDHVEPVRLGWIALAGRCIGQKRLQIPRIHERLARSGRPRESINAEVAEIRRCRAELVDARQDVAEPETAGKSVEVDGGEVEDRKSTRLNSSHSQISYAVFCLKKKKNVIY